MVKETPSLGRIAAMVAFTLSCFAILLFLWISFGGTVPLKPEGYRFTAAFPEAATLVEEADVRLAGVNVGKVRTRELGDGGRTIAEIEIESQYAPIPRDTRAVLRQKTLLGETYVELTPGDPEQGMLEDGEELALTNVKVTVELDEIYRAFDKRTRDNFGAWIREGSVVVAGDYGEELNDAFGNLAPFATDGAQLLEILDDQQGALRGVIRDTGRTFDALAREEGQLSGLIRNGNETFEALASRDDALADTFEVFPTFLGETRSTMRRLRTFSTDTNPLVNQLKGPADDIGPTVRDLGDFAPDLEQLFRDLDPLIVAGERGLPAGSRTLDGIQPVLSGLRQFLPELNPVLAYLAFSRQQVAQFITVGGAALAGNNAGGYTQPRGGEHYLPQVALIDGQSFSSAQTRPPDDRGNAYPQPNAYQRSTAGGVLESFSCPGDGQEQVDPQDSRTGGIPLLESVGVGQMPPCLVAPPSLYSNEFFPDLSRGRAPRVDAPQGREGTEPVLP
ncbi:MAG: MlaD family protein [Solirubrobacteraceae bacterium]